MESYVTLKLCCILACQYMLVASGIQLVSANRTELLIGGIFPINGTTGWQGGQACYPTAQMALDDVNHNKDLLQGYQLKLNSHDSLCDTGRGAAAMYSLLYNQPVKLFLLAGCSRVCATVAEAGQNWNLNVMCYGASSPALSNRKRFPTLFRTHPSATVDNPTRVRLMQMFGWSKIAILQQAEEEFTSTADDLEERCKTANIEIVTRQTFLTDSIEAVRNLRRLNVRIVVGLFHVVPARKVLCEIYKQNLFGKSYVWFFLGRYEVNWYKLGLDYENVNCSVDEMKMAAEGHLTTEAVMWNHNRHQKTSSGMTVDQFRDRLHKDLIGKGYNINGGFYPEGYQESPLAYDAMWAIALALNRTVDSLAKNGAKLEDFDYSNRQIQNEIFSALNNISFVGVSGEVSFSESGDRTALIQVEQMVNGMYVLLGYWQYDWTEWNVTRMKTATWEENPYMEAESSESILNPPINNSFPTTEILASGFILFILITFEVFDVVYKTSRHQHMLSK